MKERNKAVPAAYLLLKKENTILLGRRANTGYYDGYYAVPAGHVEAGELPLACLIREAEEEIGISFEVRDAQLIHVQYVTKHDETGDRANYFFVVETYKGEPKNMEPNKCDDLKWFSLDSLPENIVHHVKMVLECYQKKILFSEVPFRKDFLNPNKK